MLVLSRESRQKLGKYLRSVRKAAGVSQADLASSLGLTSGQFISNIERGNCSPTLEALSTYLNQTNLHTLTLQDFIIEIYEREIRKQVGK